MHPQVWWLKIITMISLVYSSANWAGLHGDSASAQLGADDPFLRWLLPTNQLAHEMKSVCQSWFRVGEPGE